jgi:Predicted alternative thymidylate synthase
MKIELLGQTNKDEIANQIRIVAAGGKLSRFPGTVTEVYNSCDDFDSNIKFIKRVIGMGHKSIIEHDYLVFALEDVTPIVEQTIIESRLTSFTIKSRREVDFRTAGFTTPEFRNKEGLLHKDNKKLQEKYKEHMQMLFNAYGEFVDQGINKEDARYVLPYSFHSNIIMGLDARELEKLTISLLHGKLSKIAELKELGEQFKKIINSRAPYLSELIDSSLTTSEDKYLDFDKYFAEYKTNEIKKLTSVNLISYTKKADERVITSFLQTRFQISSKEATKLYSKMPSEVIEKLIKTIIGNNENRELEHAHFSFEIPISLAVLTHITRHRMHSLMVPDFVPMWNLSNYIIPNSIKETNEAKFRELFSKNKEVYESFKNDNILEEDLIYFYQAGNTVNITTTMNGRFLAHFASLRCCNKAQWEIRDIADEIVNSVIEVAPLIGNNIGPSCLTSKTCNEKKESCGKPRRDLKKDSK